MDRITGVKSEINCDDVATSRYAVVRRHSKNVSIFRVSCWAKRERSKTGFPFRVQNGSTNANTIISHAALKYRYTKPKTAVFSPFHSQCGVRISPYTRETIETREQWKWVAGHFHLSLSSKKKGKSKKKKTSLMRVIHART